MKFTTTINDLNDDCILLIIDYLQYFSAQHKAQYSRTLEFFSYTNHRIRLLCIPTLFNLNDQVVQVCRLEPSLRAHMQALSASSFAADSTRYVFL